MTRKNLTTDGKSMETKKNRRLGAKRTALAAVIAAAAMAVAACGSAKETQAGSSGASASDAQSESTAAESGSSAAESSAASADEQAIEAIKPTRPKNLGTLKMGDYKGITIKTSEPKTVTDEDVQSYLDNTVLPNYTEEVDGPVQNGDTVNIDYVGTIDGKEFDGGSATGQDLTIGSGRFIDGFESGLVGKKKGDTVDLNVTFPENYGQAELSGKPAVFKVTIHSVKRPRLLNDALAAEIDGTVKTADEYREKVRQQLQKQADYSNDQTLAYDAIQTIVQDSTVEPSDEAVEWKIDDLVKNYYAPMVQQSYGIKLSDMLAMQGQTLQQFRDSLRDTAQQTVQQIMVLEEIAKEENLKVTDADRQKFAEDNGTTLDILKSGASDEEIDEATLQQLATDVVIKNANIVYENAADESAADTSAADAGASD